MRGLIALFNRWAPRLLNWGLAMFMVWMLWIGACLIAIEAVTYATDIMTGAPPSRFVTVGTYGVMCMILPSIWELTRNGLGD